MFADPIMTLFRAISSSRAWLVLLVLAYYDNTMTSAWMSVSKIMHHPICSNSDATVLFAEAPHKTNPYYSSTRRDYFIRVLVATTTTSVPSMLGFLSPAMAYTPDPDPLRESLYLMSRVQEATVQQERFISRATRQQDLKLKMKLTLKLVEKNYRLLDQINYASAFVDPKDALIEASEAGYEAVDALQGAIDFVKTDLNGGEGPLTEAQKTFLTTSMQSCRENLFIFLQYLPQDKLEAARKRVEEENVLNREEFDGDADAGVYNPVVLPWKNRS